MSKDLWLKRIRNYAGFLGMLLPWLSLIGNSLYHGFKPRWGEFSISATYYTTPALVAVLTAASIVLMCYDGYSKQDSIVTTISGVFGLMIVLFPCDCSIAPKYVGFFQLPVEVSNVIHCTSACIFFILLAYNDIFLFTKYEWDMTKKKKLRNKIYYICGFGMIAAMALMVIPSIDFPAKTWWVEMIALTFFGMSWLTKGGAFPFLNDELIDTI